MATLRLTFCEESKTAPRTHATTNKLNGFLLLILLTSYAYIGWIVLQTGGWSRFVIVHPLQKILIEGTVVIGPLLAYASEYVTRPTKPDWLGQVPRYLRCTVLWPIIVLRAICRPL